MMTTVTTNRFPYNSFALCPTSSNCPSPLSIVSPHRSGVYSVWEELTLYVGIRHSVMTGHWEMPRLQRLRIRGHCLVEGASTEAEWFKILDFFKKHGSRLLHVDLGREAVEWSVIVAIVEACPNLQHFMFCLAGGAPPEALHTRKIPFVDIFDDSSIPYSWNQLRTPLLADELKYVLRVWQKIRLLDYTSVEHVPELSTLLSPWEVILEETPRIHDYYGSLITQTEHLVYFLNIDSRTLEVVTENVLNILHATETDLQDGSSSDGYSEYDESDSYTKASRIEVRKLEVEDWQFHGVINSENDVALTSLIEAQVGEEGALERLSASLTY